MQNDRFKLKCSEFRTRSSTHRPKRRFFKVAQSYKCSLLASNCQMLGLLLTRQPLACKQWRAALLSARHNECADLRSFGHSSASSRYGCGHIVEIDTPTAL